MKIRGVDFIFYNVSNLKKSVEFYRDILGLKLNAKPSESWAEFETGNLAFAIGVYGPVANGGGQVAFAVGDIKKALEFLKSKKVKIVQELYEANVCFMAIVADPDGNQFMLHQRKDGTVG